MMPAAARPSGRFRRWTKRIVLSTMLALACAGSATYVGLPLLARQTWARHRVESALTRSLETPVAVSSMAWSWRDGLLLQGVSTTDETAGSSFHIDSVRLQPRLSRLFRGKLRAAAVLESPEFVLRDAEPEARAFWLPALGKKGLGLDPVEIRNGSFVWTGSDGKTVRIDEISIEGSGRLRNRIAHLELSSMSASFNGTKLTGKGSLHLSADGFSGEILLNEVSAKESAELRNALRAAHVTLKGAPPVSELF
jgi:hypothetical protein